MPTLRHAFGDKTRQRMGDEPSPGSGHLLCAKKAKESKDKKSKPVGEESFASKEFFEHKNFSYVDEIVDPDRENRGGPKGYPPSSIFVALLLMYLRSVESSLDLVRFLGTNPEWLVTLNLRKKVRGRMVYKVPDRTTFYKFAERVGVDGMVDAFSVMVVRLVRKGVIKGERVSLDCSIIWAWFKDCPSASRPNHDNRKCWKHRRRDG